MGGGSHQGPSVSQPAVNVAENPNAPLIVNYKNWGRSSVVKFSFFSEIPSLLAAVKVEIRICGCVWNTINGKWRILKLS